MSESGFRNLIQQSGLQKRPLVLMTVTALLTLAVAAVLFLSFGQGDPARSAGDKTTIAPISTRTDPVTEASPQTVEIADSDVEHGAGRLIADIVPDDDPADWKEVEIGFPVTNELTQQKCGSCHAADAQGNLSRISWTRTTPEGWAQTIKRMVNLHGLQLAPNEARSIVKYLSDAHGLAPEEAKSVMYVTERRIIDETNIPNDTVREACASCHAFGQPLSSRRTRTEWALLQNMHSALYPTAQRQLDRPAPDQAEDEEAEESNAEPVTLGDIALDYLTETAALRTPEWTAWRARMAAPRLAGVWQVKASLRGHGDYVGQMTIEKGATTDAFVTQTTLRSLKTGQTITRRGQGIVYAGYSWRGRSDNSNKPDNSSPEGPHHALRETMWFAPDQQTAEGRWYWGEYHEFGFDVSLTRSSGAPRIVAVKPHGLKTGGKDQRLEIYGDSLPTGLTITDIDLGPGVVVNKIVSAAASRLVVTVDVKASSPQGLHNVVVGNAFLEQALPVYSNVDYLKVTPETALTHLGGVIYAKGYEQFEAYGFSTGADGKPNTDDDFLIGPIEAAWTMEEFPTVMHDNDIEYVGSLNASGLFTPSVEGPNPKRRFGRNNYGEVWIVATAKNEKDTSGKALTARSYLVVTVPTYRRWDQQEVSP